MQERPVPTDRAAFVLADLQAPLLIRDANGSPLRGRFGKSEVGVKRGLEKKASDADGAKDQRKRIAAEQARLILSRLLQGRHNGTPDEKTLGAHLEWLCDKWTFGLLMKELGTASWGDLAGRILLLLRKVGRAPDTRSHSEALRALGRAEQTAAALKILHEMTSSGPSPDVWCYSEVLKALARTENLGGALAVFEEMNERGVAPNVWCCNSLVTVLCKAGRMREARGVLEAMRRCGRAVGEGSVNTPSRGSVNMPSGVSVDAPSGERGGTETSGSETAEQVGSSEHVGHLHATGVGQSTERRDFMAGFSGKWVTVSDDVTEEKGRGAGKRGEGGHTLAGKASGNNEGIEVATSSGGILQERSVRVPSVMRLRETYTVETGSPGAASVTGSGKDVEAVVAGGVGSQPAMADVSIRAHADVSAPAGEDDRLSAADDVSMLSRHPAAIGSSGGGGTGFEGVRESGREDVSAARTDGNGKTFGAGQLSGVSLNTQTGTSPEVLTEGASLREQILEADWEGKGGAQATSNRDDLGNEENVARSSWESNDLEVLRRAMLGKRPTDLGASALAGSEIETRSFSEGDHPDDVQSKGLQENCNIRLDNEPSLERGEKALGVDRGEGRDFCVEGIDKDGSVSESVGGVSGPGVGGSQQHGRIPAVGAQSDGPEVGGQRDSRKATLAESDGSGAGIETESRKDTLAQSDGSGADIETDSRNGTLTNERYEQREGRSKETSGDSPGPARLEPVLPKADVRNGVQSKADVRRALQQCLRWGAEWPATWPPPPAPDAVTYNVLIGASANESDGWRSAVELLDCMRTDGVAPTQITYNAVLTSCSRAGQWERCLECWNALAAARLPRNDFALSCVVRALGAARRCEQAVEMVKAARRGAFGRDCRLSVQTCTMAISACAQSGQRQAAVALLRWMQKEGLKPDVASYNAVMQACLQSGEADEALQFFQELVRARLRPDSHSQTLYIHSLALCGRFADALDAFWGFRTRFGVPNVITYNAAIVACGKGLLWMDAFKVFQDLDASGCAPNVTTYEALMKALSDSGELEKAMAVFQSMGARGVKPQVRTFNNLLHGYAERGAWEDARAIFDSMLRFGVRPDDVSHNILIRAYRRGGQFASAVSCFASMLEGDVTCPPGDLTYREVLTACDRGGLGAEALWALEQMEIFGGSPSKFHYGRALMACARGGDWADVEDLYQYMRGEAMEIEASVYMAMLARLEIDGNTGRARGVLSEWRESAPDYEIGVGGYNLVLGAYASAGEWREALTWKEVMEARGITPSVTTYSILVGVLEKSGRWQEAMAVFGEMPMKGGVVEPSSWNEDVL